MTSTAPGAHPEPEEVDALLDPGSGDPAVAEHVAGCASCSAVRSDLEQVRALLGAQARLVPEEPADLGARIAAALAAEPPLTAGTTSTTTTTTSSDAPAPVSDLAEHRRRRRPTVWFAAAASVAVLALGGTLVAQVVGQQGDTTAGAVSDSSEYAEAPGAAAPSPNRDGGADSSVESLQDPTAATQDEGLVAVSGTDYTEADLATQVRELLTTGRTGSGGGVQEDVDDALDRLRTLPECLAAVGRDGVPQAVDLATFEGEPATVVVLDTEDGGQVAVVVPAGCGTGEERVLATTPLP